MIDSICTKYFLSASKYDEKLSFSNECLDTIKYNNELNDTV